MSKSKMSTLQLVGMKKFTDRGVLTFGHGELVYFLVRPTNISVLSANKVENKIQALTQLLSIHPNIEIICTDARENFESNKLYLEKMAEKETNPEVQKLLRKDIKHLDNIQLQMSTAREFMFAYRLTRESEEQALSILNRIEKQINDQGFECRRADKDDIKRFISRYFGHMCEDAIDDVDGWRYLTDRPYYRRKKNKQIDVELTERYVKDFIAMVAPSTVRFYVDHYIVGDSYRCVWAIKEYPPQTTSQAIFARFSEKESVTLHMYTRLVDAVEQRKIVQNACRKNTMLANSDEIDEVVKGQGNLNDVVELLNDLRKNREPLLHSAVFLELTASSLEKLRELQSDMNMELTREKLSVDRLTLRQKEGFLSCLPCGYNAFGRQFERVLPASSVANCYPFNYSGKTDANGFLIGRDKFGTNIIVDLDKREEDKTNSNVLILGNSGLGKSYLLKLLLTNIRMSGKNIISLDAEQEYEDLCNSLGGCYIDLMSGAYIINPLEPKEWAESKDDVDDDAPEAFRKATRLSQHISFLKDFFRAYKDFSDAQIDALEILLTRLYENYGITDKTDFSTLTADDYPTMKDLYQIVEQEYLKYEEGTKSLFTEDLLRELCLGLNSMCLGAESKYFNGKTNITDDKFIVFGVKGLMDSNKKLKDAMLFNILSYMNHKLLTTGNTAASIDELYLFLTNLTAIEYIRNASKRVRKKESSIILASQNIEDFLLPEVKELTKPLFSIPTHQFLFNAGNINPRDYMDTLQIEESEFDLIKHPERGTALFKCGTERYLLQVIAPDYKSVLFGKAGGR